MMPYLSAAIGIVLFIAHYSGSLWMWNEEVLSPNESLALSSLQCPYRNTGVSEYLPWINGPRVPLGSIVAKEVCAFDN
jgi:hypothetical protein